MSTTNDEGNSAITIRSFPIQSDHVPTISEAMAGLRLSTEGCDEGRIQGVFRQGGELFTVDLEIKQGPEGKQVIGGVTQYIADEETVQRRYQQVLEHAQRLDEVLLTGIAR